jgi:hypothetical protein
MLEALDQSSLSVPKTKTDAPVSIVPPMIIAVIVFSRPRSSQLDG